MCERALSRSLLTTCAAHNGLNIVHRTRHTQKPALPTTRVNVESSFQHHSRKLNIITQLYRLRKRIPSLPPANTEK